MKKFLIITMLLISNVSIAQQYQYHKGQTIVVDSSLTIYNTAPLPMGAHFNDIQSNDWQSAFSEYKELDWIKYKNINDRCITVKPDINRMIIDIFKEVFTDKELERFKNTSKISKGEEIWFEYFVDKHSNPYIMRMSFSLRNSLNDLDAAQVGKLYKLMYERIRFNVKDCDLPEYTVTLIVNLQQVVDGTLNFDKLMKPRLPVTFEEMRIENEALKREQLKRRAQ